MAVGMTTVFAILLIVINLGKGLILLVNKYAPEAPVENKRISPQPNLSPTASATLTPDHTTTAQYSR